MSNDENTLLAGPGPAKRTMPINDLRKIGETQEACSTSGGEAFMIGS